MSAFSDAFESLLDAQEVARGKRIKVKLTPPGKAFDAIVEAVNLDLVPIPGGSSEGGGYTCMMRLSDFPEGDPEKIKTVAEFEGTTLQVLNCQRVNDVLQITIGDVTAEDQ